MSARRVRLEPEETVAEKGGRPPAARVALSNREVSRALERSAQQVGDVCAIVTLTFHDERL